MKMENKTLCDNIENKDKMEALKIDIEPLKLDIEKNEENGISPFKIYENLYCNKCEDYMGCLGLIDQMTMNLQDSNVSTGNGAFDNMVKSMGGLTFSARFKMILDCAQLRNIISKTGP